MEAITKDKHHAQLSTQHANFAEKKGIILKVCMKRNVKQLHEIVDSPNYEGQDIHVRPNACKEFAVNSFTYEEDGSSDTEAITVMDGSRIENLGVTTLKVTYGDKSVETSYH